MRAHHITLNGVKHVAIIVLLGVLTLNAGRATAQPVPPDQRGSGSNVVRELSSTVARCLHERTFDVDPHGFFQADSWLCRWPASLGSFPTGPGAYHIGLCDAVPGTLVTEPRRRVDWACLWYLVPIYPQGLLQGPARSVCWVEALNVDETISTICMDRIDFLTWQEFD